MAVCATPSCRKRKDLNADGVCPTCILHSQHKEHSCKQCKNPITDADKALVCDKCSALCHIQCTSVPEELFDLLVGNDAEDGLRWFCHECRNPPPSSVVTESSQVETNNVNSSVNQQTKVCDKLKVGTCPHGVTGKTLVGGKACEFAHPKICKRYINNGPHGRYGCNGSGCNLFHPMLCSSSVRNRKCHKANCKLYHLRWTDRGRTRHPNRQPPHAQRQQPQRSRAQLHGSYVPPNLRFSNQS